MKKPNNKLPAEIKNPNLERFKYEVAQEFGLSHREAEKKKKNMEKKNK